MARKRGSSSGTASSPRTGGTRRGSSSKKRLSTREYGYPIVPKARARAARTYGARNNTAGSLRTVDQAIRARYGSVNAIYTGRRTRR